MADITVTAAKVALVDPIRSIVNSFIATEAIAKGQAVYVLTTGKVGVADANASGKQQFAGIALNAAGAGQAVSVLQAGRVAGFTLSGNAWSLAYLSDTAGALADAAGTMTVVAGRVVCLTDQSLTKVLEVQVNWLAAWS